MLGVWLSYRSCLLIICDRINPRDRAKESNGQEKEQGDSSWGEAEKHVSQKSSPPR